MLFSRFSLPETTPTARAPKGLGTNVKTLLAHRPLRYGIGAPFFYVGAEVCIGSFLVVYLMRHGTGIRDQAHAGRYLTFYWGGAMAGRFVGAWGLRRVFPASLLCLCALGNVGLLVGSFALPVSSAKWALLACGLGNSIMFPTIFSLSIGGLGTLVSEGGGLICMAIVGGGRSYHMCKEPSRTALALRCLFLCRLRRMDTSQDLARGACSKPELR